MPLRLTLLYPLTMTAGGDSGGQVGGKKVMTVTLEAPSFYAALNMANTFIAKRINFSHCVSAVFSEELAKKEGVGKYVNAIMRNRETRPDIYIAISRCSAELFLNKIEPIQENDVSKYFQMIFNTFQFTGFTPDSQISKFYDTMVTVEKSPATALVDTSKYSSSDDFKNLSSNTNANRTAYPFEGDFKAGDIPKVGDQKCEYMGMAVFNGDKMVGEMKGEDATNLLMVTGQFRTGFFTVPDPKKNGFIVVVSLSPARRPKVQVDLDSENPKIKVALELEADFRSIQSGFNYEDIKHTPLFEKYASDFFKKEVQSFLNRTATEYGVDVCGFGKTAKKQFLSYGAWEKYHWLSKYQKSTFEVDMKIQIRRPGLFVKTAPIMSSESEEDSK